ncbi:MAG TPA: thioesterase family protein [Flavipsychrobacter sp.]|nr:thioesterase family protein [Flavipsychrobacter sp.]
MGRVKVKFPDEKPLIIVRIPVRIGDINYGGHIGNDSVLSIIHEARMQLLAGWGYDELHAGGNALIMADVIIAYRGEAFYGDVLDIAIYAEEITNNSFDLLYHITTQRDSTTKDIAHAKTGMVCFDYKSRKIASMTEELKTRLQSADF